MIGSGLSYRRMTGLKVNINFIIVSVKPDGRNKSELCGEKCKYLKQHEKSEIRGALGGPCSS